MASEIKANAKANKIGIKASSLLNLDPMTLIYEHGPDIVKMRLYTKTRVNSTVTFDLLT